MTGERSDILIPFFDAAIRLEPYGLELYLVPPYQSLVQRADGIYLIASVLAALLYPGEDF